MLELLGLGDGPIYAVEGKIAQGKFNHGLTAAHWKQVPEWLDNPVAVFDSDTQPGRLVFVAPALVRGAPVRMIVEPRTGGGVNLMINAYDADRNPWSRWEREGLLRYFNTKKAPSITGTFQPRLAGLPGQKGRPKILTERHLDGWRRANPEPTYDNARGDGPADSVEFSLDAPLAENQREALGKVGGAITQLLKDTGRIMQRNAAFTRDLVDAADKYLPSARDFYNLKRAVSAKRTASERNIDSVLEDFDALTAEERGTGPGSVNAFLKGSRRRVWARWWCPRPRVPPRCSPWPPRWAGRAHCCR